MLTIRIGEGSSHSRFQPTARCSRPLATLSHWFGCGTPVRAPLGALPAPQLGVRGLAFSSVDPLLAIAGASGRVTLWDCEAVCQRGSVLATGRAFESVVFSNNGKQFATGGVDGTVRFWDLELALEK